MSVTMFEQYYQIGIYQEAMYYEPKLRLGPRGMPKDYMIRKVEPGIDSIDFGELHFVVA